MFGDPFYVETMEPNDIDFEDIILNLSYHFCLDYFLIQKIYYYIMFSDSFYVEAMGHGAL